MTEPIYEMKMTIRSNWIVGYHPEMDEIFIYYVDHDDLCFVFRKGGLDVIGFSEFMDFSKAEILGDL